ncbi:MAG: DNA-deoxyinosine glycosylase [Christensenellales bacterium]|jgi:TDG/mug DNA glycosylase family protein|nr:DNA-deoxyinosine glycosylase [Clostridiales bacterium]
MFTHGDKIIKCFAPIYNDSCKVLILGSMPSIKSLEHSFYYMHKTNRFWKVMAYVLNAEYPQTIEQKKKMMLDNGVALWDVIFSCQRKGSLDSAIKNITLNDLASIKNIEKMKIFANGKLAYNLMKKHFPQYDVEYLCSTSSANVRFDIEQWLKIRQYL